MAQLTMLHSNAVSHLEQIRVFIGNTKNALSQLLSTPESMQTEESMERIQELYEVLKDLKEQERTYIELLNDYSNVQVSNQRLRESVAAAKRAEELAVEEQRRMKLDAIRRANDAQRSEFPEVIGSDTSASATPSECRSSPSRRAATSKLSAYEKSLNEYRKLVRATQNSIMANSANNQSRPPARAREREASGSTTSSANEHVEQRRFAFETDTDVTSTHSERTDNDFERPSTSKRFLSKQRAADAKFGKSSPMLTSSRLESSLVENAVSASSSNSFNQNAVRSALARTRAALQSTDAMLQEGGDLLELLDRRLTLKKTQDGDKPKRAAWSNTVHIPKLEIPSRSSRATSDEDDQAGKLRSSAQLHAKSARRTSQSTDTTSNSTSGSVDRAARKRMRERRRELEEVQARVRRHEALLGSLRTMQAQLAATPGIYTAPELLALTNEIIDEVSDDVDEPDLARHAHAHAAKQSAKRHRESDTESQNSTSSAFASNAESQDNESAASASKQSETSSMATNNTNDTSTSSAPIILTKERLHAIRLLADLTTDSECTTGDEAPRAPTREENREQGHNLNPNPNQNQRKLKQIEDSVRSTANLCESLAIGQQRMTDLLASFNSAAAPKTKPTPTPTLTSASASAPMMTSMMPTQNDVLNVLVGMQQQLLAQQCELLRLRQQLTAAQPASTLPWQFSPMTPTPTPVPAPAPVSAPAARANRTRTESAESPLSFSAFGALRDRIYSEVVALIVANEKRPRFVVELFSALRTLRTDEQRERVLQAIHDTALSRLAKETASHASRLASNSNSKSNGAAAKPPLPPVKVPDSATMSESESRRQEQSENESITSSQHRFLDKLEKIFAQRGINSSEPVDNTTDTASTSTFEMPMARDSLAATMIEKRIRDMMTQAEPRASQDWSSNEAEAGTSASLHRGSNLETTPSETTGDTESESETGEARLERLLDESLQAIDTPRLDAFIKKLIGDLIAKLRDHLGRTLNGELRAEIRRFIMRAADRLIGVASGNGNAGFAAFFSRQLDAVLGECLAKYDARRMQDCFEQMLVDVSELLFNEFAFFRVVRNLDADTESNAQAISRRIMLSNPGYADDPEVPQNSSAVDTENENDNDSTVSSDYPADRAVKSRMATRSTGEPVRIELSIDKTKPYLRVVRDDEEGDSDSDLSDSDDDGGNRRMRSNERDAVTRSRQKYEMSSRDAGRDELNDLDGSDAVQQGQSDSRDEDEDDADFAALHRQIAAQNGDAVRNGGLEVKRDRLLVSGMYDESFSVAESSENEKAGSSEMDADTDAETRVRRSSSRRVNGNASSYGQHSAASK